MLGQRFRQWANIKLTLVQVIVFAVLISYSYPKLSVYRFLTVDPPRSLSQYQQMCSVGEAPTAYFIKATMFYFSVLDHKKSKI